MGPKALAKRYLGETRLWSFLRTARYHARRLRNLHARLLARGSLYRKLQSPRFYGERYFDMPKDAMQVSGYGEAYSDSSEFGKVAELAQELFRPHAVLDVGCAKGFQVAALRSRGIKAWGIDISEYAVESAPPGVSPWLKVGNCTCMDYPDGFFDLVLVLETLEHIPPAETGATIRELRRVGSRWLWASVPCMGENPFGRDGLVESKVKDACLELYRRNTIDLAPLKHLILDVDGFPIHGHVTIASFAWWTAAFNRWGFIRRGDLERAVNEKLYSAREGIWNCMVFEKAPPAGPDPAAAGRNWPFAMVGEGAWETEPIPFPAGVYRVDLEVAVAGTGEKGEPLRRAVYCWGHSAGGERINASALLSAREMRRGGGRGRLSIPLICSSAGEEEISFRIGFMPGMEAEPLPVSSIRPCDQV